MALVCQKPGDVFCASRVTCKIKKSSHRPTRNMPHYLSFLAPTRAKLPFQSLKCEVAPCWPGSFQLICSCLLPFSVHVYLPCVCSHGLEGRALSALHAHCNEQLWSLTCKETKIYILPLPSYPPATWEHTSGSAAQGSWQREIAHFQRKAEETWQGLSPTLRARAWKALFEKAAFAPPATLFTAVHLLM